jgi:multifunctional methyltransferase subunit TRM112
VRIFRHHYLVYRINLKHVGTELVVKILGKTQLPALRSAAKNLGVSGKWTAPEDNTIDTIVADEDMLQELHHFLFELHVLEGHLVCPESGRRFPIKDGIPNMLLHEDEV